MLEIIQKKWNDILDYIKHEYDIADVAFVTWLVPLKVHSVEDGVITIVTEESFGVNYINKKFYKYFKVTIAEMIGEEFEIKIVAPEDIDDNNNIKENNEVKLTLNNSLKMRIAEANLNPKYTFDTFVVGGSNNFAHAYALKVAEAPGEICNPLFLYGGVGLGKTHLMHSIAHYILEHNPNSKVLYVTSETFTNELINVIRNENQNAVMEFRNKYRNIDVLLIDDIQFIIGKERCQEEFFHTFNTLYEANKQIIISSDKPPKEMTTLEERLRSRFEFGLPVDISSPEYETRMAILRKKAEIEDYEIKDEILQYIATNIVSNIRELEGALNRVIAYSKISPLTMDLELAKQILKDSISPNANVEVTAPLIIQIVAEHCDIPQSDLASKKKMKDIVLARQIAMYLCRTLTEESLSAIGNLLGKKDHTTVMHGFEKISAEILVNEQLRNTIETIKKKILPN
ncbi:MAG: chromosomal replication initiator protein DnaA [Lachnospiraceae bacterium]|nr:chromosomal replication initiator protein DnaA [Lachnospiraceae bacterium]